MNGNCKVILPEKYIWGRLRHAQGADTVFDGRRQSRPFDETKRQRARRTPTPSLRRGQAINKKHF